MSNLANQDDVLRYYLEKCRICLKQSIHLQSIYPSLNTDSSPYLYLVMFTKLDINIEDKGPKLICQVCLNELEITVKFQKKCEFSNKWFRKHKMPSGLSEQNISNNSHSKDKDNPKYPERGKKFNENKKLVKKVLNDKQKLESEQNSQNHDEMKETRISLKAIHLTSQDSLDRNSLKYPCIQCNTSFESSRMYNYHVRKHRARANGGYKCEECGKLFRFSGSLKVHKKIHIGIKPHICHMCDKKFLVKDHLVKHIKRHLNEREHCCEACGKGFCTKWELKTHRCPHGPPRSPRFRCIEPGCTKQFTAKANLLIHQRVHTGEKPYECQQCGNKFSNRATLKVHIRLHTNEKPYICSVCGARFRHNILAAHMRSHTGERPYRCGQCAGGYSSRAALTVHMRRHQLAGAAPNLYRCPDCPQQYKHSQSLNKHRRKQHMDKIELQGAEDDLENTSSNKAIVQVSMSTDAAATVHTSKPAKLLTLCPK